MYIYFYEPVNVNICPSRPETSEVLALLCLASDPIQQYEDKKNATPTYPGSWMSGDLH